MKLKIKETKVSYKEGRYFYEKMFIKASSQEGNVVCLLNGDLISAEEGNKIFISLKKKREFLFLSLKKEN